MLKVRRGKNIGDVMYDLYRIMEPNFDRSTTENLGLEVAFPAHPRNAKRIG